MFQGALWWDAEAAGTAHMMLIVMGTWSDSRFLPTIPSVPDPGMLLAAVPVVLRPSGYVMVSIMGHFGIKNKSIKRNKTLTENNSVEGSS